MLRAPVSPDPWEQSVRRVCERRARSRRARSLPWPASVRGDHAATAAPAAAPTLAALCGSRPRFYVPSADGEHPGSSCLIRLLMTVPVSDTVLGRPLSLRE